MRIINLAGVVLLSLLFPAMARGQAILLHGSAGPTLNDPGVSIAFGAGFAPTSHLSVQVDVERTHLFSQAGSEGGESMSAFRGGTLALVSPQVRFSARGHDRVGPYAIVGFAAGISKPTVNDTFPNPVTNDVRALFFGGGLSVPLTRSLSLVADARMMLGAEAGELLAIAPVRVGLTWRF